VEYLSKLQSGGPPVSVGEEIRGLFHKALASSKDSSPGERQPPPAARAAAMHAARKQQQQPRQRQLSGRPAVPVAAPEAQLDQELAATEAQAIRLAMQKEARRLQGEAQARLAEFEGELQEELEHKVAGLLMEKEHKVAEAAKLKDDLQGRISQLQLMMAQLDDKVTSYAESYDHILFELRKEYSALITEQRQELEQENKKKLTEHMFALRKQRQMPIPHA